MIKKSWAALALVLVLAASTGLGTAHAGLREPRRRVVASFSASFAPPILAVPCDAHFTYNRFVVTATGKEVDLSAPAAGLGGHFRVTLSWVEDPGLSVLGHMKAQLTDPSSGATLYSGGGTFVGREGPLGTIAARGLLDAVLYANGSPTARHLVANFAFQLGMESGHVSGGFGDDVPTGPSTAVETTAKNC